MLLAVTDYITLQTLGRLARFRSSGRSRRIMGDAPHEVFFRACVHHRALLILNSPALEPSASFNVCEELQTSKPSSSSLATVLRNLACLLAWSLVPTHGCSHSICTLTSRGRAPFGSLCHDFACRHPYGILHTSVPSCQPQGLPCIVSRRDILSKSP